MVVVAIVAIVALLAVCGLLVHRMSEIERRSQERERELDRERRWMQEKVDEQIDRLMYAFEKPWRVPEPEPSPPRPPRERDQWEAEPAMQGPVIAEYHRRRDAVTAPDEVHA